MNLTGNTISPEPSFMPRAPLSPKAGPRYQLAPTWVAGRPSTPLRVCTRVCFRVSCWRKDGSIYTERQGATVVFPTMSRTKTEVPRKEGEERRPDRCPQAPTPPAPRRWCAPPRAWSRATAPRELRSGAQEMAGAGGTVLLGVQVLARKRAHH